MMLGAYYGNPEHYGAPNWLVRESNDDGNAYAVLDNEANIGDPMYLGSPCKSSSATYRIRFVDFKDYNASYYGQIPTEYTLNGNSLGMIGDGHALIGEMSVEVAYSDLNLDDHDSNTITCDEDVAAFVPPDVRSAFSGWGSGNSYIVGSCVTKGGNYYICIQAHTSSSTNAPDVAGGDAYWDSVDDCGWMRPNTTSPVETVYSWAAMIPDSLMIKPYFSWA